MLRLYVHLRQPLILHTTGSGAGEDKLTGETNASKLGSARFHSKMEFRNPVVNKLDQESNP
jgi:hypothetical protein